MNSANSSRSVGRQRPRRAVWLSLANSFSCRATGSRRFGKFFSFFLRLACGLSPLIVLAFLLGTFSTFMRQRSSSPHPCAPSPRHLQRLDVACRPTLHSCALSAVVDCRLYVLLKRRGSSEPFACRGPLGTSNQPYCRPQSSLASDQRVLMFCLDVLREFALLDLRRRFCASPVGQQSSSAASQAVALRRSRARFLIIRSFGNGTTLFLVAPFRSLLRRRRRVVVDGAAITRRDAAALANY